VVVDFDFLWKSKSITTTVVSLIPGHGEPKEIKVYHNSCESDSWSWRAKGNQSLSRPGIRLTTVVVIDFDFLWLAMTRNQTHNCCDRLWFPLARHDQESDKVYHNSCESDSWSWQAKGNQSLSPQQLWVWFLVMASQRKSKSITTVVDFDFLWLAMTRNQTHNCCGDRLWFPLARHDQESDSQLLWW
jgi:hypothetical protein